MDGKKGKESSGKRHEKKNERKEKEKENLKGKSKEKSKGRSRENLKGRTKENSRERSKSSSRRRRSKGTADKELSTLEVQTATILGEKIKCIDDQLGLLRDKEAAVADQYNALKKENKNNNVNSKAQNKNINYPFATYGVTDIRSIISTYDKCFISRVILFSRLTLPTISIRLECDGVEHGPFRALLDSGAQPNLISYTLFKQLKCVTTNASRRLLGVASMPLTIKRKMNVIIRPWFESDAFEDEVMHIMPHDNSWKPILPSQALRVDPKNHAFRQTLADPEYFLPK